MTHLSDRDVLPEAYQEHYRRLTELERKPSLLHRLAETHAYKDYTAHHNLNTILGFRPSTPSKGLTSNLSKLRQEIFHTHTTTEGQLAFLQFIYTQLDNLTAKYQQFAAAGHLAETLQLMEHTLTLFQPTTRADHNQKRTFAETIKHIQENPLCMSWGVYKQWRNITQKLPSEHQHLTTATERLQHHYQELFP